MQAIVHHLAVLAISVTPGTIIVGLLLAVALLMVVVEVIRRGHLGSSATRKATDLKAHHGAQWVEMMGEDGNQPRITGRRGG